MEDEEKQIDDYEPKLTKFEEDNMKKVKEDHKKNLTHKQVVAGKEFKGTAFIAKPDVILFKDFELGKVYKQKILVTNVSFSFNSFKMLSITDAYKDFFEVIYSPSGRMSAGLSTSIEIVFTPKVNADIITVLPLLAETGPIDIPLQCLCRKAIVKPDKTDLDFGNVIYGEEGKVKIVLTNTGALPVGFEILSLDGKKLPFMKPVKLAPSQLAENLLRDQEKIAHPELFVEPPPAKIEEKKEPEPIKEPEPVSPEVKKDAKPEVKKDAKKTEAKKEAKKIEAQKVVEAQKVEEVIVPEEKKEKVPDLKDFPGYKFLSQIDFPRSGKVEGYSTFTINMNYIPIALGSHQIKLLVKFDNDKYSQEFNIELKYFNLF